MFSLFRGQKAALYIFFEMIPSLLLGLVIFLSIILMFQFLRLTDFALSHGMTAKTIGEIIVYLCVSLLPALLPMSLLFSVLLTYGRLSTDSEIVAMKAAGLHMGSLLAPAMILGLAVAFVSAQTSFTIAPWGNRQFEVELTKIGNTKAAAVIKPGTFSEGFFSMVIYANEVDSKTGVLKNLFIYDDKSDVPLTILAKSGEVIPDPENPGHSVLLRLYDGNIHRKSQAHTKIKFNSYDIQLNDPIKDMERAKSPPSLTLGEIKERLKNTNNDQETSLMLQTEWHKRLAVPVLCLVFSLIGVGLGTTTNRRQQKAGGMVLSIGLIIAYWILYVAFEGMARGGKIPPGIAIWVPNLVFGLIGFQSLKKNWN